ncbi:MAG: cation-translocating P-type ATPase [Flavobacteriales bacterium]|nr:cation-translocating P-type ATPase [Flavobacteriales bacterium]
MSKEITVNVDGMTCANCAAGIHRKLTKAGYQKVDVSFATGEVTIEEEGPVDLDRVRALISDAGYTYVGEKRKESSGLAPIEKMFLFTLPFTLPLLAHMVLPWHVLHDPLVQLALCLPVMAIGIAHFGKSAFGSLRNGVPNMDVLIFIGSVSAFVYSIVGVALHWGTGQESQYLFFETAATIITLVLMGNVIEHRAVKQTTTAISDLGQLQEGIAKKTVEENGKWKIVETAFRELVAGNLVQVNSGDSIPADGILESGALHVNESMITGESEPVRKVQGETLIGGTIVLDGNGIVRLTATGQSTVLAGIIAMVKKAQQEKPSMQRLADRVSAVFVPVVVGIALLTFLLGHFAFHIGLQAAIMNAVAVLVISCPCAMGLATPTAVMVGLGPSAKGGILFKGGESVEQLSKVKRVVFDKTGTLTTGEMRVGDILFFTSDETEALQMLAALEEKSSHSIAKAVVKELENRKWNSKASGERGGDVLPSPVPRPSSIKDIEEEKGLGMRGTDAKGRTWQAGSFKLLSDHELKHAGDVNLLCDGQLVASLTLEDDIRPDAKTLVDFLHSKGIETVLLSGDRQEKCDRVAKQTGIHEVYAEQRPEDKLRLITQWADEHPTAMVGDGINDAPALTRATVGISLSGATQVAVNAASVVIMDSGGLLRIREAFQLGHHTVLTIKQNLFWAFAYNMVAIPLAAFGFLNPMVAALSMAFSDVVVIGNAVRFKFKRLD